MVEMLGMVAGLLLTVSDASLKDVTPLLNTDCHGYICGSENAHGAVFG